MSATTGRMSRADAAHLLLQIQAAAHEFVAKTPSEPANPEAFEILEGARLEHDYLDASRTNLPRADAIRALRSRVAALQAERLLRSCQEPPRFSRASVVTLYGIDSDQPATAATLAALELGLPSRAHVRLQDSSPVRTATLTGTRYIFTTQAP